MLGVNNTVTGFLFLLFLLTLLCVGGINKAVSGTVVFSGMLSVGASGCFFSFSNFI